MPPRSTNSGRTAAMGRKRHGSFLGAIPHLRSLRSKPLEPRGIKFRGYLPSAEADSCMRFIAKPLSGNFRQFKTRVTLWKSYANSIPWHSIDEGNRTASQTTVRPVSPPPFYFMLTCATEPACADNATHASAQAGLPVYSADRR